MKRLLFILLFTPLALFGQDNYSMSFDGVDDGILVNHSESFEYMESLTISFDVMIYEFPSNYYSGSGFSSLAGYRIIEKWDAENSSRSFEVNLLNEGVLNSGGLTPSHVSACINGGCYNAMDLSLIELNKFNNISLVFDGDSLYSYLNGNHIMSSDIPDFDYITYQEVPMSIGNSIDMGFNIKRNQFDGKLDNVQIWRKALSENEVKSIIPCPLSGQEEGLVGYWNFNEGSGDTVYDISGNGNHGIIHGATYSEDVPEESCVIEGCTDSSMYNFNDKANTDDGSCEPYSYGCVDSTAYNFDEVANTDDGSCISIEEFTIDSLKEALSVFETVSDEDNYSMNFDGNEDNVQLSNSISFGTNSFSVSIDCYLNAFEGTDSESYSYIVGVPLSEVTNDHGFKIQTSSIANNGGFEAHINDEGTTNFNVITFNNTIQNNVTLNNWYSLTMVVNRINNLFQFYVDGTLVGTQPISSAFGNVDLGVPISIGYMSLWNSSYLDGLTDNLHIWNKPLTQQEIQNYMTCPPTGEEEGLIGYWNFNEGSGDTVYDLSGNGNHGIIHGATYSEDVPDSQKGCTDIKALNYDETALCDNGSCVYAGDQYTLLEEENLVLSDSLSTSQQNLTLLEGDASTSLSSMQLALDSWNTTIDLDAGWNMFGYGCPESIDLVQAMSEHTDNIIIIKDNSGKAYMPQYNFNGIGDLTPGLGYQIKVTDSIEGFSLCDWYVNDITEDNIVSLQDSLELIISQIGCCDSLACNYDLNKLYNDSSCEYPEQGYDCDGNINIEVGVEVFGGIVFYIDETGEHGLVAATEDLIEEDTDPNGFGFNGYEWGCFFENVSSADGQAIGTGYQNTIDIVSQGCVTENGGITAAQAALDAEISGYSDWYLPSRFELVEMYNTIGQGGPEGNIGFFENRGYWSSSESNYNNDYAWYVFFSDGGTYYNGNKGHTRRVRVIRAF